MVPKTSTTISDGNGSAGLLDPVAIAFKKASIAAGLTSEAGQVDKDKVRARIFGVLLDAGKVLNLKERAAKAVTRGDLTAAVYRDAEGDPTLAGPDAFDEADDPVLAKAIWDKADEYVWSTATPSATDKFQWLVGSSMGNGYVMCRTKVGNSKTPAAYITANRQCIETDFIGPEVVALQRKATGMVANREMLIYRQPENADHYAKAFDLVLKDLALAVHSRLTLAVTAAKANGIESGSEDGNGDGSEE